MSAQSKAGLSVGFAHFIMCVERSCLCNNSLQNLSRLQIKTLISAQGRVDMQEELRNLVS
jgi:hypothetical protein